jgi:hypothetical protein
MDAVMVYMMVALMVPSMVAMKVSWLESQQVDVMEWSTVWSWAAWSVYVMGVLRGWNRVGSMDSTTVCVMVVKMERVVVDT